VELNLYQVPALTDPALISVDPVMTLLDLIMAENSREYSLIHIPVHRILLHQLIRYLINPHEHERQFSLGTFFFFF